MLKRTIIGSSLAICCPVKTKTVVVCSTSPVLAHGIRSTLAGRFSVSNIFPTIQDLEENIEKLTLDLLLIDVLLIEMSAGVSLDTLRRFKTISPASQMVLWIDSISPEFVSQCLAAGIRGVISKGATLDAHIGCISAVAEGRFWIDHDLSKSMMAARQISLTRRERQMISLLVQGMSNKELAWAMGVTEGTVKVYLSRLYPKVGVSDRFELAMVALKNLPASPTVGEGQQRKPGHPATIFPFPATLQVRPDSTRLQTAVNSIHRFPVRPPNPITEFLGSQPNAAHC